ncbi:MAG: hypothetical protein KDA96_14725 [Planctomycetaceae bacterium]|nr:hypothetical protein [Planctomycetaceae bacterium]
MQPQPDHMMQMPPASVHEAAPSIPPEEPHLHLPPPPADAVPRDSSNAEPPDAPAEQAPAEDVIQQTGWETSSQSTDGLPFIPLMVPPSDGSRRASGRQTSPASAQHSDVAVPVQGQRILLRQVQ